jgi:hypothetical protein
MFQQAQSESRGKRQDAGACQKIPQIARSGARQGFFADKQVSAASVFATGRRHDFYLFDSAR